ncbi:hypothetical protein [Nocardia sp. CA-119907]|uniref:hypothetical protein n=1 Tax=Nocardia sp. CA-119907 TaxID=3239973 RepID=UPI003D95A4AB
MRVILSNPRYTGRQVWNKQRKTKSSSMSRTSLWGMRPGCDGTTVTSRSSPITRCTSRSSTPTHSNAPSRSWPRREQAARHGNGTAPTTATCFAVGCGAGCASGGCKASEAGRCCSTDAGTPTSTP